MKGRDVYVKGGASSSKKKDPLKLIYKLMPLVFSDETSSSGFVTHEWNGEPVLAPWVVRFGTNEILTDFSPFDNFISM